MIVNLYKLYILSCHFSPQPNNRVFLPSNQTQMKENLIFLYFFTFSFSHHFCMTNANAPIHGYCSNNPNLLQFTLIDVCNFFKFNMHNLLLMLSSIN